MDKKEKQFASKINKELKIAKISRCNLTGDNGLLTFRLDLKPTKYFKWATLSFNDSYRQLIENTVLEFYNDVPTFNNNDTIFWFEDRNGMKAPKKS